MNEGEVIVIVIVVAEVVVIVVVVVKAAVVVVVVVVVVAALISVISYNSILTSVCWGLSSLSLSLILVQQGEEDQVGIESDGEQDY